MPLTGSLASSEGPQLWENVVYRGLGFRAKRLGFESLLAFSLGVSGLWFRGLGFRILGFMV